MKLFAYYVRRFFAFGMDWYLSAVLINMLTVLCTTIAGSEEHTYLFLVINSLLVSFIYFVLVPTFVFKGQTLIMKPMYLKMVSTDDKPLTWKRLTLRYFVGCLILEGAIYMPSVNIRSAMIMTILKDQPLIASILTWTITISTCIGVGIALLQYKEPRFLHDRISHTKVVNSKNS